MSNVTSRLSTALADRYQIEKRLGEGGMATVYLAEDLKHQRKVALKVLKPDLAAVLGAERFVQEITTTANLQHPHILPLFDSGTAGETDGGTPFLYYVMPYVEGETLRDKLDRETQLSVDESVKIAGEVLDALHHAHEQGVIHRDIKPENILLQNGRPMVADFGIALAVSAAAGGRMTETGLSLGTPHYMSPEQATAEKDLTARSDVYSVGSVLYEMLTGSPPHVGASAQQIIMKIVTEEAQPVTALRKSVPPNVAAAVAKSLEKLPADRFDTAKAFAGALVTPGFTTSAASVEAGSVDVGGRFDRRVVGLAIALVGVAALAAWALFRPQPPAPVARYHIVLPDDAPIGGPFLRIAITPDGAGIVYVSGTGSQGSLWLRERGQLLPTRIVGSDGAQAPFIAPDGNRVGFYTNGELRAVSLRGGPATPLADSLMGGAGASWGVDGFIYSDGRGQSPLARVSAAGGGAPEWFTSIDSAAGEQDHFAPDVLPNGKGVVFIARRGARSETHVAVAPTSTGDHRLLVPGVYARYARSGHLLWVTVDGTLMAAAFDQGSLEFTGESVALEENITPRILTLPDLAIAHDGTLLYTSAGGGQGGGTPVWVDRTGRAQPVAANWTSSALGVALSPDGTRLAASIEDDGEQHVWIRELTRNMAASKLTFAGSTNERPTWASDGNSVVFVSDRLGDFDLFMRRADGTAEAAVMLDRTGIGVMQGRITPDGEWLVYREGGGASANVLARRISGDIVDTVPVPLAGSGFQETTPVVSPDGRWLAFTSDETGRSEIYIRPFPDVSSGKWLASVSGGTEPLWSRDGRELFYRNGDGDMVAAEVLPSGAPPIGEQHVLFSAGEYLADVFYQRYDVTPDGQRFVMVRPGGEGIGALQFVVVENFFEELKEKVGN